MEDEIILEGTHKLTTIEYLSLMFSLRIQGQKKGLEIPVNREQKVDSSINI